VEHLNTKHLESLYHLDEDIKCRYRTIPETVSVRGFWQIRGYNSVVSSFLVRRGLLSLSRCWYKFWW